MAALVTVRYWAGARRAAGRESEQLHADTVADLLAQLSAHQQLAPVVAASAVLVDELAADSAQPLHDGAVVDILPPFAGG